MGSPEKCVLQGSWLVRVNENQDILESPLVVNDVLGIENSVGANFARTVWGFRFGRCTRFGLSGVVISDERCVPGLGMIQSFLQQ